MKTLFYSLLWLVAVASSNAADSVPNKLYRDYLEAAIRSEIPTAGDVWDNAGAGGYLFCFKFDLNNDGHDELFVTSSLSSHDPYADWTVYHENSSGNYVPYSNTIALSMTGFYIEKDGTSATFVDCSSRGYKYYASYQKVVGETVHINVKEISEKEYYRLLTQGGLKQVIPKLKAIHLVDFLRDPKQHWIDVNPTTLEFHNVQGFVRIPEDTERVKAFNLSPKEALQKIQQMKE